MGEVFTTANLRPCRKITLSASRDTTKYASQIAELLLDVAIDEHGVSDDGLAVVLMDEECCR